MAEPPASRCPVSRGRIGVVTRRALVTAATLVVPAVAAAQPADDLASLSDEFDRPARLAEWSSVHEVEGWTDKLKRMEVSSAGVLTLEPWPSVWFHDFPRRVGLCVVRAAGR